MESSLQFQSLSGDWPHNHFSPFRHYISPTNSENNSAKKSVDWGGTSEDLETFPLQKLLESPKLTRYVFRLISRLDANHPNAHKSLVKGPTGQPFSHDITFGLFCIKYIQSSAASNTNCDKSKKKKSYRKLKRHAVSNAGEDRPKSSKQTCLSRSGCIIPERPIRDVVNTHRGTLERPILKVGSKQKQKQTRFKLQQGKLFIPQI